MGSCIVRVVDVVKAPAERVYALLADYREGGHPRILPRPAFGKLVVEEGGVGAGTVIWCEMTMMGRKTIFRSEITEPAMGVLVERDLAGRFVTRFAVVTRANEAQCELTIETVFALRGVVGWIQGLLIPRLFRGVYLREMELIKGAVEGAGSMGN